MAGIMIPITMSQGIQRAREDNQADQRFAMDKQFNERRLEGLDMSQRRDRMELDEAEKDRPLRDLQRKAQVTSEMARQAFVMLNSGHPDLGEVPDDQVAPFMAKFLTDTPVFGETKLMPNGAISDGKREIRMDRQTALKMLAGLADPAKAMQLAQQEQQYINEHGKIETMTAGEAESRGLEAAADKVETYRLNKARIEDQYAEDGAKLGLDVKKAQIAAHNRANREKPDETQFVSPDGKTARTMGRKQGLEMGWTPLADFKATQALQGGGLDPYAFSKQTPDAIRDGIIEQTMLENGYQMTEKMSADGTWQKVWTTPDGNPVPQADVKAALDLSEEVLGMLSSGRAADPVDAMNKVKTRRNAPPVPGAKRADDGQWYVQKDGKWFRVRQQ